MQISPPKSFSWLPNQTCYLKGINNLKILIAQMLRLGNMDTKLVRTCSLPPKARGHRPCLTW
jgi:hypothetical protein